MLVDPIHALASFGDPVLTKFLWPGLPVRLYTTSSTWMDDRAPFVQMITDGNESGDSRRADAMNVRWTANWT